MPPRRTEITAYLLCARGGFCVPAERLRPFIKMARAPKTPIAPGTPALQEHEWGSLSSWPPYPSSSADQLQVQGGLRGGSIFVDTKD